MTNPPTPPVPRRRTRTASTALYLTIGTLLAAAVLGGYFIIIGDQANIAGRAWLTLLLVALFAGAVVLDANVSDGPNQWYLAASTITNVVLVAVGLLKLWNGWLQGVDTADPGVWSAQLARFLAVIVLLRVALVLTQVYWLYFFTRAKTQATKATTVLTIALMWVTVLVLAVPAAFPEPEWPDWWWRTAAAAALVTVVSAVIPLVIRAFEPKAPKPVYAPVPTQQPWDPRQAQAYGQVPPMPQTQPGQWPPQAPQVPGYPVQQPGYPAPQQPYPQQPAPAQPGPARPAQQPPVQPPQPEPPLPPAAQPPAPPQ